MIRRSYPLGTCSAAGPPHLVRPCPRIKPTLIQHSAAAGAHAQWTCPTCRQPLLPAAEHLLRCEQGHTSLRAKEGYVHLLPSGRKPSPQAAGDSEAMVRARRAFFDAGHYKVVAEAVAASVLAGVAGQQEVAVLDAGCGEGTYLGCIHETLQRADVDVQACGVDVSKLAVRLAAKRAPHLSFAVASSYRLPFQDQVLDAVVSVFAPCPAAEISRVLKPGGCLVAASPGRDHLSSIKALIYDNPQPFPSDKGVVSEADQKHCGLALVDGMQVVTELVLEGQDAQNLLTMTPYFWRASKEVQQQIASLPQLRTTVDITVTRYQRLS